MNDPQATTHTNPITSETQVELAVEVIPVTTAATEQERPVPRDKLPLTQPVLSRRQREAIERSMTGPAEASRAQFRGVSRDKNSEGRKRSSPTQRKDPEVMNTETQTNQNGTASQVASVPRAKEMDSIDTMTPLKFSLWAVGTVAAVAVVGTGISLAGRALAKRFGLNTPITVVQS